MGQSAGNQQHLMKSVTARLLILGAKQTGKSATIVRYTTGRYIQQYNEATSGWLYRRSLGFDERHNSNNLIELMEQKDIKFSNTSNLFATDNTENAHPPQANQSLASRVASDQRKATELHERQELLSKLQWANAYVIIYAINDAQSFTRAIDYLNLIANHINQHPHPPLHLQQQHQQQRSGSSSSSTSSCSAATTGYSSTTTSSTSSSVSNPSSGTSNGAKLLSMLTLAAGSAASNQQSLNNHLTSHNHAQTSRKPILLLANKRDLLTSARQVSTSDGRILAQRHQSLFAEISVAESQKLVESCLGNLLEQIDPANLHISLTDEQQISTLTQWTPTIERALNQTGLSLTAPVWGSLSKSKPLTCLVAESNKLPPVTRLETGVQLVRSSAGSVYMAKSSQVMASLIKPMSVSGLVSKRQIDPEESTISASQAKVHCNSSAHRYQEKYEILKLSFKRASMAIVSNKMMSRSGATNGNKGSHSSKLSSYRNGQRKGSSASSDQESINELQFHYEPTINEHQASDSSPSWIRRSHIRSLNCEGNSSNQSDSTSITESLECPSPLNNRTNIRDRFMRPIFKYKNRRKTVAFDTASAMIDTAITASTVTIDSTRPSSLSSSNQISNHPIDANSHKVNSYQDSKSENRYINFADNTNSSSSKSFTSRSSLSLANTKIYYNSLNTLIDTEQNRSGSLSNHSAHDDKKQANISKAKNSTSNLSKLSSLDRKHRNNNSNNMNKNYNSTMNYTRVPEEVISKVVPVTIMESCPSKSNPIDIARIEVATASATSLEPIAAGKKRYGLVKTVQNTISNFTGSSSVSRPQIAAKRSFCKALFKHSNNNSNVTPITVKKVNHPSVDLATTEHIQTRPTLVGYCK